MMYVHMYAHTYICMYICAYVCTYGASFLRWRIFYNFTHTNWIWWPLLFMQVIKSSMRIAFFWKLAPLFVGGKVIQSGHLGRQKTGSRSTILSQRKKGFYSTQTVVTIWCVVQFVFEPAEAGFYRMSSLTVMRFGPQWRSDPWGRSCLLTQFETLLTVGSMLRSSFSATKLAAKIAKK
jgi:hypothetical protein